MTTKVGPTSIASELNGALLPTSSLLSFISFSLSDSRSMMSESPVLSSEPSRKAEWPFEKNKKMMLICPPAAGQRWGLFLFEPYGTSVISTIGTVHGTVQAKWSPAKQNRSALDQRRDWLALQQYCNQYGIKTHCVPPGLLLHHPERQSCCIDISPLESQSEYLSHM